MKNKTSIFWGVVLIVVGVLFLGNNLEWWDINLFFKGWWTLFIIIPSIYEFFDGNRAGATISLSVGILLLLSSQGIIAWSMIWKILVPIIIIVIGVSLMFSSKIKKKLAKNAKSYVAIFSEVDEKIKEVTSDFSAVSIFGGVNIDLRKAKIEKDLYIEATTIFGGIEIRVPDNVNVKCDGVPIFGGAENKTNSEGDKTVTIHYTCIFGGVDIL